MSPDPRRATAARLERALRVAVWVITVGTTFGFALPLLLANPAAYRSLTQQVVAFGTLTAVAVVAAVFLLLDRPLGRPRWALLAAVCVASALATTGIHADELMSEAEWSYGVIGWFGLVVLLEQGAAASAVFLGAFTAASFAQGILLGQDVVGLVVVTVLLLGCQLPVVAVAAALHRLAAAATAASRREEELRTADAVADRLHETRRARYADLAATTVPLLTRLAEGRADLGDDRARAEYAVEAAKLRRLFAEHDDVSDPLLHELRGVLDLADRRGVATYLGTCGDGPTPPLPVRRALTEPAVRVVAVAASEARVTVLGSPAGVTISVVADAEAFDDALPEDADVAVTHLVDGSRVWVEATWQAPA